MKHLNTYITEYIIKKKLEKPIDSEYKYYPETKEELLNNIKECLDSKNYDLNCIDTSKITDMSSLFYDKKLKDAIEKINISKWDVSNVTNMRYMFCDCINFTGKGLENWDVSNVKTMDYMFLRCNSFRGEGLENWNVSNVKTMEGMFAYCNKFEGKVLENWNVSNVKNMSNMFDGCKCFNCDLSGWNVSNVENMNCMFINCDKFDCDLSNWNVSNVLNMICMFSNCKNFKGIGLDNWNVSKIKTIGGNMMNMLNGCKSIIKEPKGYRFKIK